MFVCKVFCYEPDKAKEIGQVLNLHPRTVEKHHEDYFKKGIKAFESLDQVEDLLEAKLNYFEDHPEKLQSIVGYAWIIDALNS